MKAIPFLFLFVFALLLLPACREPGEPSSTEEAFTYPPVGVIRAADYAVTLHTGPDGPLYTIVDEKGERVAREISRTQLAAEFPELNEELKGLWAGNDQSPPVNALLP